MKTPPGGRRATAGFSLLEMVIAIILICILVVVAMDRLLVLRVAAEKAAVERTLVTLRTVIVLELADRLIEGADPRDLEGGNPMELWDKHVEYPLPKYAGSGTADAAAPGTWHFRPAEHVLVYRTLFPEAFRSDGPDPAAARFRMALSYGANGQPTGIRLLPLDKFVWNAKQLAETTVN
jgi:prepilin-type N-terminal cleavage/methylation domain-containing protein